MRAYAAALAVLAFGGGAFGQVVAIEQLYRIFPQNPGDDRSLRFFAAVDVTGLSGSGTEQAPIFRNFVSVIDLNGSTAGGRATPNVNVYLDLPRNLRAEFVDGVFSGNVSQIDDPGTTAAEYIVLRQDDGIFAGVFLIGPEFASWGPDVLSPRMYRIESSTSMPSSELSPADFDGDASANIFDLIDYLRDFDAADLSADLDEDSVLTAADIEIAQIRIDAVSP